MNPNAPTGAAATLEEIELGMTRSLEKRVTDRDIELFAEVSEDRNPIHLDDAYAQNTIFGGRIAHGMFTASLISAVLGGQLPGHGAVYMEQSLRFLAPVRPLDLVRAEVEVVEVERAKRRVRLDCRCFVGATKVLEGSATVLVPSG